LQANAQVKIRLILHKLSGILLIETQTGALVAGDGAVFIIGLQDYWTSRLLEIKIIGKQDYWQSSGK
jgi:hypothetical protein